MGFMCKHRGAARFSIYRAGEERTLKRIEIIRGLKITRRKRRRLISAAFRTLNRLRSLTHCPIRNSTN